MAAGEFKLAGGATGAMDAEFEASPRTWLPEVDYSVEGTSGVLRVTQPNMERFDFMGDTRNVWDVKLTSGVPVDLDVEFGAGDSTVDLSQVDVRELHVLTGAGETTVDLTGPRTADVTGDIEAGVGRLTVKVPSDVGVRITGAQDGIGDFNVEGFSMDGDAFVNDAWDTAAVKIELRVQRGVGEVTVEQQS
jgi:predicted membrane protein